MESKIYITLVGNILTKNKYLAIIIYVQIPEHRILKEHKY